MARRVRKLGIRLSTLIFENESVSLPLPTPDHTGRTASAQVHKPRLVRAREQIKHILQRLTSRGTKSAPKSEGLAPNHLMSPSNLSKLMGRPPGPPPSKELVAALYFAMGVISSLPGVIEYEVEYSDWRLRDLPVFLSTTLAARLVPVVVNWPGYFSSLRRLSIAAPLEIAMSTLLPSVELKCLEVLELLFLIALPSSVPIIRETLLADTIVPFMSRLRPTLRQLTIASLVDFEPSAFFGALGFFPNLSKVDIGLKYHSTHTWEAPGLVHFLNDHARTLRHLSFGYAGFGATFPVWFWYDVFSNATLPSLKTFEVNMRIPREGVSRLASCIGRFADTLTTLVIKYREFRYDKVALIADLFSHRPEGDRLSKLQLSVAVLTPQVLDLLARTFPHLELLILIFTHLLDTELDGMMPEFDVLREVL